MAIGSRRTLPTVPAAAAVISDPMVAADVDPRTPVEGLVWPADVAQAARRRLAQALTWSGSASPAGFATCAA